MNRFVRLAWILGIVLLIGAIAIPAWLWNRTPPDKKATDIPLETLDVVCTGRVDAQSAVRGLDPPPPGGRVAEVHVKEGATVKKGDPIVTIDSRAYLEAENDANRSLDAAKLELSAAELRAKQTRGTIEVLEKQIEAAKVKAHAAKMKLNQMKAAYRLTDKTPYTQADIDVAEAEVQALNLNIEAEQKRLADLKEDPLTQEVQMANLRIATAEDAIKKAQRYVEDCVIRAPLDGTVIRLQAAVGGTLTPGNVFQPAIIFAPAGPLIVRAELDQADAGRIKPGMKAVLTDDVRRNSPIWTGTINGVSDWIARKRDLIIDPGEPIDVRTLEITILLDPSEHRLWIGQRMVVRIAK